MTLDYLGGTAKMGHLLRKEVERQLLKDLVPYGIDPTGLTIDWTHACQEGHCTQAIDGNLEDLSSVLVINATGEVIADGWMDFIHGGDENPLFVFWLFLDIKRNGAWIDVKSEKNIPPHIWAQLPESTKRLCIKSDEYDARWANDPSVLAWKQQNNS